MNLGIISRGPLLYSTRRLVESAAALGHAASVVDPMASILRVSNGTSTVVHRGESLPPFDAVIPRIGPSATSHGLALIRQLELTGAYCVNGSDAVARGRDKLRCLQALSAEGLPVPRTAFASRSANVEELIELVGGPPVVIKLLNSSQGIGVMLAETAQIAHSVLESFLCLGQSVLVQEFVREANGRDLRALVVGDEVVAAIRRQAADGDFRANIHRGGTSEPLKLDRDLRSVARQAARTIGLEVAGVDMIESHSGPLILELNVSPGLEGVETVTGVDVASRITNLATERAHRAAR